jgi:transcriptional regulator with XRE-family HTH domain
MKIKKLPKEVNREDLRYAYMNIACNIQLARIKVGLSQKEMAEKLGYKSATGLSLMESGKRGINAVVLWNIAEITQEPINNFYLKGLI